MFSVSIPIICYILSALALICALSACICGMSAYRRAARFQNPAGIDGVDTECPDPHLSPSTTVVVYCQSDEETLLRTLGQLDNQDYTDFDIVVVCDSGEEYSTLVSEKTGNFSHKVYSTFVQPGSHNLSRRKLANTIGIKAAKGEIVLTTAANIQIPSERWLSDMMAAFCGPEGKFRNFSLGATMIDFSELRGATKWYRQFDGVLNNGLWIGYASAGKPFRGDALNLAFRRSFFFEHKGYADTNHLQNGDDDVLLRKLANGSNTAVTADTSNILTTQWGSSANRIWNNRKAQYDFTKRWLRRGPFVRDAFLSAMQWVVPALVAAIILTGLPSVIPAIAATVILLGMWGYEIYAYRRLAARLGAVRLWWAVVPFWFLRPVINIVFNFEQQGTRKKNYTWQR